MINIELSMNAAGFGEAEQACQYLRGVLPELRIKSQSNGKMLQCKLPLLLPIKDYNPEIVLMRYRKIGRNGKKWVVDTKMKRILTRQIDNLNEVSLGDYENASLPLQHQDIYFYNKPERWFNLVNYEALKGAIGAYYLNPSIHDYSQGDDFNFSGGSGKHTKSCRFAIAIRMRNPYFSRGRYYRVPEYIFSQKAYMTFRGTKTAGGDLTAGIALVQD